MAGAAHLNQMNTRVVCINNAHRAVLRPHLRRNTMASARARLIRLTPNCRLSFPSHSRALAWKGPPGETRAAKFCSQLQLEGGSDSANEWNLHRWELANGP